MEQTKSHTTKIAFAGSSPVETNKILHTYTKSLEDRYSIESQPKIELTNSLYGSYYTLPLDIVLDSIPSASTETAQEPLSSPFPRTNPVVRPPSQVSLKLTLMNDDTLHPSSVVILRDNLLFVVCFDINKPETLEEARLTWFPRIRGHSYARRVPIFLLVIGSELRDHEGSTCLTYKEGSSTANQLGAHYFELATPITSYEDTLPDPATFSQMVHLAYEEANKYNKTLGGRSHRFAQTTKRHVVNPVMTALRVCFFACALVGMSRLEKRFKFIEDSGLFRFSAQAPKGLRHTYEQAHSDVRIDGSVFYIGELNMNRYE
ncbi:hypothetical protein BKA70DRAFT_1489393 [Coprinopsis sp. MPI-PUGE-AT-0042]|nr:hypothetical protein BKA70DRAFT_1489393 [Coprinopsis sp. MPI-PUGE-AT-0042]